MRLETLVESKAHDLELTDAEAAALQLEGQRLASAKRWWGSAEDDEESKSVIRCERHGAAWRIYIDNAVGVIRTGDLQLNVMPKIPPAHLLYLLHESETLPRLGDEEAQLAADETLWHLVARWYLRAAEALLRRDLIRDYEEVEEELRVVRGRVQSLPTARAIYSGRVALLCRFEEFMFDTPLNRVVRAAGRLVASSPSLPWELRRRALSILSRMNEVGELRPGDTNSSTDRRTRHYRDALTLARHILSGTGRALAAGETRTWTFLLRTPEDVERGVRANLARRLPALTIEKRGKQLPPSHLTLNPDVVIGTTDAVADVKYKLAGSDWPRADLYQVVAFAAGYEVADAALISFGDRSVVTDELLVGAVRVRRLVWPVDVADPAEAADALATQVLSWLAAEPGLQAA